MEFTEAIPAFGGKARLSPNGRFLARLAPSSDFILLVQETNSLAVYLSIPVPLLMDNDALAAMPKSKHFPPPRPRRIQPQDVCITWSPDSSRIMVADQVVHRVFVFDIASEDPETTGYILQESMPTSRFLWSPKSDYIISVLEHKLGLRVWSLDSRFPIKSITGIKSSTEGIDFCQDGNMMAVLHQRDAQDFIAIYSCTTWDIIQVIAADPFYSNRQILKPPESSFLEDIRFATGQFARNHHSERPLLYAWELPCLSSRLIIFEPDGSSKVVDVFTGHADLQESFGFNSVVFSPSSDLAALISNDAALVLWNSLLQKPITKMTISSDLSKLPNLIAFKEKVVYGEDCKFVRYESGYDLMLNELQGKTASQLIPELTVKFSADSKYLAIHSCTRLCPHRLSNAVAAFPNHLWVFSVASLSFISVMCQLPSSGPVRDFDWHPEQSLLGLVTGSEYVYFWQPEGCHCIPQPYTPDERCSRTFQWANVNVMLMAGQENCCLAVPDFINQ